MALHAWLATLRHTVARTPPSALAFAGSATLCGACVAAALTINALQPPPPLPATVVVDPLPALAVRATPGALAGGCQIVVQVDDPSAGLFLYEVGADRTIDTWSARATSTGGVNAHRFIDLPAGTYHVNARTDGDAPAIASAPVWTCAGRGERADFHLRLERGGPVLTGRVTGHGKRAIGGAEVLLAQPEGRQGAHAGVVHVPLAPDGTFSVTLGAGSYEVLATAPHHTAEKQAVRLEAGARATSKFALAPAPMLAGVVFDSDARPVAGAVVSLGGIYDPKVGASAVVADDEGRYELPIPMGVPLVVVARGAGKIGALSLPPVADPSGRAGISVVVGTGRAVTGEVMTQRGEPHPFAPVRFRVRALGLTGVENTDAQGRFVVDGMPAVEDVELWADGSAIGAWGGAVSSPGQDRVLLTWVPPAY